MGGVNDDPFPNLDLSCLTPRQREVIEMHYGCCLTIGQIAAFLGISRGAVQSHLNRSLAKLLEQESSRD